MIAVAGKTVGEIVADNYKAADVFKKYGIDFCCGGNISLSDICDKKKLNFEEISSDLAHLEEGTTTGHDFNNWSLDKLINHILMQHHTYVAANIPTILQYSEKVARVHGDFHPETKVVYDYFSTVAEELTAHMQKEEVILFPFIKDLVTIKRENKTIPNIHFGSVANPIQMMEAEHEEAGDIFKKIEQLTNGYTPPAEACNTYKVLYAKLKEFEADLHQHIHLENNILFPKAKELEASI